MTLSITMEANALDKQVAGDHYKDLPIQPVEYIHANTLGGRSALIRYRSFSTWVFRLP